MRIPSPSSVAHLSVLLIVGLLSALGAPGEARGQAREIDRLLERSRDDDLRASSRAAIGDTLVGFGAEAAEPLVHALDDRDFSYQSWVRGLLERIGEPAVEALLAAVEDSDEELRRSAARALGDFPDPRVSDALSAALSDPDEEVRQAALHALADHGDRRAVAPALFLAGSSDEDDRRRAAGVLSSFEGADVVEALVSLLGDESRYVRAPAAWGLQEIADPSSTDALLAALGDEYGTVRGRAAAGLASIGAPAVDGLLAVLSEGDAEARLAAASALAEIDDQRARAALDAARGAGDVAAVAGAHRFFVARGNPESVELLVRALEEHGTREMAEVLVNCGHDTLEEAATAWAVEHGYRIQRNFLPGESLRWGRGGGPG